MCHEFRQFELNGKIQHLQLGTDKQFKLSHLLAKMVLVLGMVEKKYSVAMSVMFHVSTCL